MKTTIKIELDTALVREVQRLASKEGTSVNALLTANLQQIVCERKTFEEARKRALARLSAGFDLRGLTPRSRDELHER